MVGIINLPVEDGLLATQERHLRIVHKTALATALVSLLPIGLGSLVTTLGAGMAFLDWPASDGQGMLTYPWLNSSGDKFVEHGHRLAGVLIGLCSMGLFCVGWTYSVERSVRVACSIVLAGVVVQGLIGGLRVRLDRSTIAIGHSVFGCLVFVALWMTAALTSRRSVAPPNSQLQLTPGIKYLSLVFPVACLIQYMIGSFLRHLGLHLDWHLAGSVVVSIVAACVVGVSARSCCLDICVAGRWVMASVVIQVLVGIAVWVTKFGLPSVGIVAVQHSLLQITTRSLHTITGMCLVGTASFWSYSVLRSWRRIV